MPSDYTGSKNLEILRSPLWFRSTVVIFQDLLNIPEGAIDFVDALEVLQCTSIVRAQEKFYGAPVDSPQVRRIVPMCLHAWLT